ncbi:MAG: hypothetical protein ABEJ30_00650 [Halorientalis sp.]
MERTRIGVVVAVVGLLLAGGALAVVAPGTGGPPPETPTPTRSPGTPAGTLAVNLTFDGTSECGRTCRLLGTTLRNNGSRRVENATLVFDIYSGGERVWEGTTPVGTLAPGEATATTTRVDVGIGAGIQIRSNGGNVTIVTTVRADSGTRTFRDSGAV